MFNRGIRDEKISGNHNDFSIEEGHFTMFFFLFFCGSTTEYIVFYLSTVQCTFFFGGTVFESYVVITKVGH